MNIDRLLQMIVARVLRRGIRTAINRVVRRGKAQPASAHPMDAGEAPGPWGAAAPADDSPEAQAADAAQARQARELQKQARQARPPDAPALTNGQGQRGAHPSPMVTCAAA